MSGFLFRVGVTTAATAVEGAAGRSATIWDVVAAAPGRIVDGSAGPAAADHLSRRTEDLALLAGAGVQALRFTLSWARSLPGEPGDGLDPAGLDAADRWVDDLLAAGIEPWPVLYDTELPLALMLTGGWLDRDTASWFGDFAAACGERLADRAAGWTTLADPFQHLAFGHAAGVDAPGLTLLDEAFPVTHHLLLGHAVARDALHDNGARVVGISNQHSPVRPATDSAANRRAALQFRIYRSDQFAQPVLRGRYPRAMQEAVAESGVVLDGDLQRIHGRLDFYGVEHPHPITVAAAPDNTRVPFSTVEAVPDGPATEGGWEVDPAGLADTLHALARRYPDLPPLVVTENGAAYDPTTDAGDAARIAHLTAHLEAVRAVAEAGVPVLAHFHRSLIDGWEGSDGFTRHHGLVAVDPVTGDRTARPSLAALARLLDS
ncbi:glycoside hydrolase family 1 protein [Nakamurella alba]|uniref:glycoside hydrolase family 1 protein n=1 Tax=Nakamurella alba TaxID=2665158 RepID=UPI0018AACDAB|nr:family 1 glycosylhydrolase [Nakamurella alba]